jgi:hypothetical protein
MGNRVGLILGAVQSRTDLFSCVLPSWVDSYQPRDGTGVGTTPR